LGVFNWSPARRKLGVAAKGDPRLAIVALTQPWLTSTSGPEPSSRLFRPNPLQPPSPTHTNRRRRELSIRTCPAPHWALLLLYALAVLTPGVALLNRQFVLDPPVKGARDLPRGRNPRTSSDYQGAYCHVDGRRDSWAHT